MPELTVVWRAFELRPDPVPTLEPGGAYLVRVWNQVVYPMAQRMGLPLKLPPVQPRSRLAHEAAAFAREGGRFGQYNGELFRAFFERGEDIGEIDTLVSLAERIELDAQRLRQALDARHFERSVLADEELAGTLGIAAVPAFVADRRRILSGVQRVEALRELFAG